MNFFNTFIFLNIIELIFMYNLLVFLYYKFITRKKYKYKLYTNKNYYSY